MPELPEVETITRSLRPILTGRRIAAVRRRGKFIVMEFQGGGFFIIHLGMTGKLLFNAEPGKHTHAILTLDRGVLLYDDPRQFGRLEWSQSLPERIAKLGPEP